MGIFTFYGQNKGLIFFMIMNKDTEKIIFGSDNQNLGYESALKVINDKTINGYLFKAEAVSGRSNCYYLRLITLAGTEYNIWGSPGYLNSQPATGSCCFILGLKDQDGQDIKDGAGKRCGDLRAFSGGRGGLDDATGSSANLRSSTSGDGNLFRFHFLVDSDLIGGAVDIERNLLTFNLVDVDRVLSAVYLEFEIFHCFFCLGVKV